MVPTPREFLGPVSQDVDLLASKFKYKLDKFFFFRYRDLLVEAVDALVALRDHYTLVYAFPLVKHLPHLLCRTEIGRASL